jgi:hypothetical protein
MPQQAVVEELSTLLQRRSRQVARRVADCFDRRQAAAAHEHARAAGSRTTRAEPRWSDRACEPPALTGAALALVHAAIQATVQVQPISIWMKPAGARLARTKRNLKIGTKLLLSTSETPVIGPGRSQHAA